MEPVSNSGEESGCVYGELRGKRLCVWRVERKACACMERDSEGGLGET